MQVVRIRSPKTKRCLSKELINSSLPKKFLGHLSQINTVIHPLSPKQPSHACNLYNPSQQPCFRDKRISRTRDLTSVSQYRKILAWRWGRRESAPYSFFSKISSLMQRIVLVHRQQLNFQTRYNP